MIGITGSVGKSSATAAIVKVLEPSFSVAPIIADYNTELGLLCSLFRQQSGFGSVRRWLFAVVGATVNVLTDRKRYEKLVMEMAVSKPGDMTNILRMFQPEIAIFIGIGQAHLNRAIGQFADEDAIFEEKAKLIRTMERGTAVLNHDDPYCRRLGDEDLKADRLWYGRLPENRQLDSLPSGLYFHRVDSSRDGVTAEVHVSTPRAFPKLESASHTLSCPVLGEHHLYVLLPAVLTGLVVGLSLEESCEPLKTFFLPRGRMNLIPGIKSSEIIDSTWNASPKSVEAALKTLGDYPAQRRIALLGSMLNLGDACESTHRAIGRITPDHADLLITVGSEARLIAEAARARGMPDESITCFDTPEEAGLHLEDTVRHGDVVLAKGSRPVFLERAIESIMKD
jgi:UDP-N-acetylmuramoyl-tripeptide--D-alanyl-D-alanine ligase